jgi:predicted nucleotidyltransferase
VIPEEFALPLIDFVNRLERVPHLRTAILFGSVAEGEVHKKSDIDVLLLFEMKGNPETRREGRIAHEIASEVSKRHGLKRSFSFVMYNVNELEDAEMDFLKKVMKKGIGIWIRTDVGALTRPHSSLRPKTVISYSLSGLTQREKMAVHRALYGYRVEKSVKGKVYVNESPGLIEDIGEKLGPGLVLVESARAEDVIEILKKYGAELKSRDVWI